MMPCAQGSVIADKRAADEEHEKDLKRLKVGEARVWDYVCRNQLLLTDDRTQKTSVSVFGKSIDVVVTCNSAVVEDWIGKRKGETVFGLDSEWKPNFIKGEEENKVAILQICGRKECLIVQMLFLDQIPPALVDFLKDKEILLGGVGIKRDVSKLMNDYQLVCRGTVDLGGLAMQKLGMERLRNAGLKSMASEVIGVKMDKPKRVTMSNWAYRYLRTDQVNYACVDAWVSYALLQKLLAT